MKTIFAREFQTIDQAFGQTFTELFGGGKATLELEDPEDIQELREMIAQHWEATGSPPGPGDPGAG